MLIKSDKQARSIINKVAGGNAGNSVKDNEIKLLVGCQVQNIGGSYHIQGCYYKKITPRGFIDTYGSLWKWNELFENNEDGAFFDEYTE